jgi:hypothetical protein
MAGDVTARGAELLEIRAAGRPAAEGVGAEVCVRSVEEEYRVETGCNGI